MINDFFASNYSKLLKMARNIARGQCSHHDLLHECFYEISKISDKEKVNEAIATGRGMYYVAGVMRAMMSSKSNGRFYRTNIAPGRVSEPLPVTDVVDIEPYNKMLEIDCVASIFAYYPSYYAKLWHLIIDLNMSLRAIEDATGIARNTLHQDYLYIKNQIHDELKKCIQCG